MGYGKMKYKKGGAMKAVPKGNKGLAKLPTAVRNKMGYMMDGGEKMLMKMTYGGSSMDMSDPMVERMRMGGSTHSGKSTTEPPPKKPTAKPWIQDPMNTTPIPSRLGTAAKASQIAGKSRPKKKK